MERGRRSWLGLAGAALLAAAGLAGAIAWLAGFGRVTETHERLVIAESREVNSAPLHIAAKLGYFADEGLDVTVESRYPSGKASLAAMLAGHADIAAVADTPVIMAVLGGKDLQIFATMLASESDCAIIARRDHGITQPADLPGKRLGSIAGTSCDYVTGLFLADKGLPADQVTLVPLEADRAAAAMVAGEVDALSAWPSIRKAVYQALGREAVTFSTAGVFTNSWNLAALRPLIGRRPQALRRLLRALVRAEDLIAAERERAVAAVAERLGQDRNTVIALWPAFGFRIGLDQLLVINMEGQARAEQRRNSRAAKPDILSLLHLDAMLEVDPARVKVIY